MDRSTNLRQRRESVGLTQTELARLADASRSMVRVLEAGYEPRRTSAVRARVELVLAARELEAAERAA